MRYFRVEKEEISGPVVSGEIYADGGFIEDTHETKIITITTGFSVFEMNEQGMTENVEFYPVTTNTSDWSDDAEEQIENIKRDYPADEWQNNEW